MLGIRFNNENRQTIKNDCIFEIKQGSTCEIDLTTGGHWYGHGFAHRQPYPLEQEAIKAERFAVNNIQAPIWLASNGYALLCETNDTLAVSLENGKLKISPLYTSAKFLIFTGKDLPEAHKKLMRHLGWPAPSPNPAMLGDSLFCTWTQYPRAITQDRIIETAKAIRKENYPVSTLIIDDRWESGFGELRFSNDFPDPVKMIRNLHEMNFKILLWVTPFVNRGTANFEKLNKSGWLVPAKDGQGSALFTWWGGTAGLVDLTNPEARAWYKQQLLYLKNELKVDGFKIDGGDAKYQPDRAISAWHNFAGDSGYSDLLLGLFEEVAPNICESRTAWLSHKRQIIWREGGKDSHWGIDNGMTAMVTLGLHLSLMGYDLLIPDMIPGRMQTMVSSLPLPTDEFFVRWVEASAFMPVMQFSYFPWNYCSDVNDASRQYSIIHKLLEKYIHHSTANRTEPLIRPLWYNSPSRSELYTVADEFMLGADLVIAPVLSEGKVTRDLHLPDGIWLDAWTGKLIEDSFIKDYPAPLPGVPLFVRASNAKLFEILHKALQKIKRGSIKSAVCSATWQCGLDRDIKVTG
ncbi:MAG: hypothetical protein JNL74_17445 [Fibrobacteres bacterium]|nr:hypothetical protein [Fibrobacterota bacterium]